MPDIFQQLLDRVSTIRDTLNTARVSLNYPQAIQEQTQKVSGLTQKYGGVQKQQIPISQITPTKTNLDPQRIETAKNELQTNSSYPIVAENTGKGFTLLDGHHRLEAAKSLGLTNLTGFTNAASTKAVDPTATMTNVGKGILAGTRVIGQTLGAPTSEEVKSIFTKATTPEEKKFQGEALLKISMLGIGMGGGLEEAGAKAVGKIAKKLQPLAQEARKYKSAEEFMKNNPEIISLQSKIEKAQLKDDSQLIFRYSDQLKNKQSQLTDFWNKAKGIKQ